jgi:hypothetical protein
MHTDETGVNRLQERYWWRIQGLDTIGAAFHETVQENAPNCPRTVTPLRAICVHLRLHSLA